MLKEIMFQTYACVAVVLLCIQYTNGVSYANGIAQCDAKWTKTGCFASSISKFTMLFSWRDNIKWDKKEIKAWGDKFACTCAAEAKKVGASGFALFWWGQCFALTLENIEAMSDNKEDGTCYKLDGSYATCKGREGNEICVGDDSSVFVFTTRQVDGGFSEWGPWSKCPVTCGGGVQNRTRLCNDPAPSNGGAPCDGLSKEQMPCNESPCPVNGGYGAWGDWGKCSKECGGGLRERTRLCNSPSPAHGGKPCDGPSKDSGNCNMQDCPVNGGFGPWSQWTACTFTCGGGITKRVRNCDNPAPKNGGKYCQGEAAESKICSTTPCHSNGGYKEWSQWSACSVKCGGGSRKREQVCEVASMCGTKKKVEGTSCNTHPCPVDGGVTDWSAWSQCNKKCGGGVKSRDRKCTNPIPEFGGKNCAEKLNEKAPCNTTPCPVDGKWSTWAGWSNCTALCGGGTHQRWRVCNNPATAFGGKSCPGTNKEVQKCNEMACAPPPTLPPHASCQENPESRLECGYAGITKAACEKRGCCFNNKFPRVKWCYRKRISDNVCAVNPEDRKECGFRGITKKQCESRAGCCFNDRTPGTKWCYRSSTSGGEVDGQGKKRFQLCEHAKADTMYLSCPKGKVIFIHRALYGRRSLTVCPKSNHKNRRNCGSYWKSLRISRRRCQNRRSCTLAAKNSMFYDPCRYVEKYLDVTWSCRTLPPRPVVHRVTICEHAKPDIKKISCPKGTTIYMKYAFYGRRSRYICPSKNIYTTRCGNYWRSRYKARRLCNGKSSCALAARNTVFGDPCRGTVKYLSFTYICRKSAHFDNWSSWSKCSAKCGRGVQIRRRVCRYNGRPVYYRRCPGRRYQSRRCTKDCKLDAHLTNCISSNTKQIIQDDYMVRRGGVQKTVIQKLGKNFEIVITFTPQSLRRGYIFQIRRYRNRYNRDLAMAYMGRRGALILRVHGGTRYRSYFLRYLKPHVSYTMRIQQKRTSFGRYAIYMKLYRGSKLERSISTYNTRPVTSHYVKFLTVPGWRPPANVKIQKFSISGYCTAKPPAGLVKKVFTG